MKNRVFPIGTIITSPFKIRTNPFYRLLKIRNKIFFQDFSNLDEAADKMENSNRLKELVTEEQRESNEPFINNEQVKLIFSCYALMNFGFLGAVHGENPFELFKKAQKGERESILKVIQVE